MFNELKLVAVEIPKQVGSASGSFTIKQSDGICDVKELKRLLDDPACDVVVIADTRNNSGSNYKAYYRLESIDYGEENTMYCFSIWTKLYAGSANRKKTLEFTLDDADPYITVTSYSS